MKTHIATPEEIKTTHACHLVDADGKILGRLASQVANLLRGKHKPIYTPFLDTGDHVVVVNAEKIVMTGQKLDKEMVRHHTLFPGGLKEKSFRKAINEEPEKVIMRAVWGMLPKNSLGRKMLKKLRVYRGEATRNHQSEKPAPFEIK